MKKTGASFAILKSKSFFSVQKRKFSKQAVRAGGEFALSLVKKSVSSPAKSEKQLADMDHPFARRHGKIKGSPYPTPNSIGSSSGRVKKAVKGRMLNQYAYRIEVDESSPHVRRLINGTRIMLGRDIIGSVLGNAKVKKMVFEKMKSAVKK